jgi:hypothetical protein
MDRTFVGNTLTLIAQASAPTFRPHDPGSPQFAPSIGLIRVIPRQKNHESLAMTSEV